MDKPSRRDFFQVAGALGTGTGGQQQHASEVYQQTRFAPASAPVKISDNLYQFEDTCLVYLIRDGDHGLLIDFGSGKILDHLPALGVKQIDYILHTHHHRDQCQGDHLAVARGIPIAVPAHERHLFADAENFWRNRRIFHLYYMRNDFQTLTQNVPVARSLEDYTTFRWRNHSIYVQPTPGHTLGSISLLMEIDGRRIAFTGDLLFAPGKLPNLYDTQVNYGGSEGVDLAIYALARLREQRPALLAPSHGELMREPDQAIEKTVQLLTSYYRFQVGNDPTLYHRPYAVSPHLIAHYRTMSSFYVIVSDSGKAMFIDYGSASDHHFWNFQVATATNQRIRFMEHSIDHLKREYGIKSVDVAMPSHMHDDHMNGFPHLVRNYGTKIWCYENMVEIFQNPRGQNLGCILAEPVSVSRAFRHGEKFRWEEFEFEITHSPGHTEYQMALFVTIDGQRVAFTGDAFFADDRNEGMLRHNIIFRNHVENDSHLKSIRNLIAHEPTLIAPGHGKPYAVTPGLLSATEQKLRKQQQFFFDMLPENEVNFGLDPSWCSIYPYQIVVYPGRAQTLEIRVRNYYSEPMKLEVGLVMPKEWRAEPDVVKLEIPANGKARAPLTLTVPKNWSAPAPRFAIAADVVRNGHYLGQITEAVVDVGPLQAW